MGSFLLEIGDFFRLMRWFVFRDMTPCSVVGRYSLSLNMSRYVQNVVYLPKYIASHAHYLKRAVFDMILYFLYFVSQMDIGRR